MSVARPLRRVVSALGLAVAVGCGAPAAPRPVASPAAARPAATTPSPALEQECAELIGKVNPTVRAIEDLAHGSLGAEQTMDQLAALYEGLARDLRALHLESPEIARDGESYAVMCDETARLARGIADAVRRGDSTALRDVSADFEAIVKREDQLVDRINETCHATPERRTTTT